MWELRIFFRVGKRIFIGLFLRLGEERGYGILLRRLGDYEGVVFRGFRRIFEGVEVGEVF